MIILDTDHISVLQHEDSPKALALLERLEALPSDEAVVATVVTLEEQSRSWLSLIGRYTDVRSRSRTTIG